jgi:hypothetical protein
MNTTKPKLELFISPLEGEPDQLEKDHVKGSFERRELENQVNPDQVKITYWFATGGQKDQFILGLTLEGRSWMRPAELDAWNNSQAGQKA